MAGIKPDSVLEFYRLLHRRGETTGTLAAALGLTNHTYVSRLVNGHGRRRGSVWWPRLRELLTAEEQKLIGGEAVGDRREAIGSESDVPAVPVVAEYAYPTVRAAVAALAPAPAAPGPRPEAYRLPPEAFCLPRPADPAVSAFINWRQRRTA